MTHHTSYDICDKCGKNFDNCLFAGQLHHYDLSHKLSHERWGEPIPDFDFCPDCYPEVHKMLGELLQKPKVLRMNKGWRFW